MTTITIQEGDRKPTTIRVFGLFDPNQEPWRWFDGGDRVWSQCERCLDIYAVEHENAPDDSCECWPCRERAIRQKVEDAIDGRKDGVA